MLAVRVNITAKSNILPQRGVEDERALRCVGDRAADMDRAAFAVHLTQKSVEQACFSCKILILADVSNIFLGCPTRSPDPQK